MSSSETLRRFKCITVKESGSLFPAWILKSVSSTPVHLFVSSVRIGNMTLFKEMIHCFVRKKKMQREQRASKGCKVSFSAYSRIFWFLNSLSITLNGKHVFPQGSTILVYTNEVSCIVWLVSNYSKIHLEKIWELIYRKFVESRSFVESHSNL